MADTSDNTAPGKKKSDDPAADVWLLEDVFPKTDLLLSKTETLSAADADVLVVLDTNALMLPLSLSKQKLPQMEQAYQRILDQKRLYVPARVVREFVKNRDRTFADLTKNLVDHASKVRELRFDFPPLLAGLEQTKALHNEATKFRQMQKSYADAIGPLIDEIKGWKGNDPVTTIYNRLFSGEVIVEGPLDREQIQRDWAERLKRMIPPGYKDGGKPDTGIGDYLIWLTILHLGENLKKSMIFVSGEEKADWFVRAGKEHVYLRLELVDEYRRASGGKHIQLATLAEVLSQMEVSSEVVQEVHEAELIANTAVQTATTKWRAPADGFVIFDYSTYNGELTLGKGSASVSLRFSKASDTEIHLLICRGTAAIARARRIPTGSRISFDDFDSTSSSYRIGLHEVFLAKNQAGFILVGRINAISDDRRGAPKDEVTFTYRIFAPGEEITAV
ncbi:PIN domain-containing protein [Bradyrhizobium symbiodeficiens]|uniref:PIN-like domain-containing protein n=1 Tax=Bradyrhizobium symbiodeficiens TaxID=1404367 RepID=UPI0030D02D40